MRILANGLSATSLSGQHVLLGHVRQIARAGQGQLEVILLTYEGDETFLQNMPTNVRPMMAPRSAKTWIKRYWWERTQLPSKLRAEKIDVLFTPNGALTPGCDVPQIVLAQNPWCLMPQVKKSPTAQFKALLQRRSYRDAWSSARLMAYNSEHMRDLYHRNADNRPEGEHLIAHQGIDDETHAAGADWQTRVPRIPTRVLTVSVMAAWKGVERVARVIGEVRRRQIPVEWAIVGPWPDPQYRQLVEAEITKQDIADVTQILGKVSKDDLHRSYAQARVFCLLSDCESFGIPAVEAQAFGTPVIGSSICAMPEITGVGGRCFPPTDHALIVDELSRLLTDEAHWSDLSAAARQNAERFRWEKCSQPLVEYLFHRC